MTKLRIPAGVEWKLLVANNHCTDNTDEVIARFADRLPIRRVFESRLGKSYACNLLVREATGDLILWTDDDVLVDSEWLVAYLDAAKAWPEAAFWGGRVDPLYGSVPPGWVVRNEAQVSHCFGLCQYERTVRPLAPGSIQTVRTWHFGWTSLGVFRSIHFWARRATAKGGAKTWN